MIRSLKFQVALELACLTFAGGGTSFGASCTQIGGLYQETAVPLQNCTSPVGLCTTAIISGNIKGVGLFTAAAFIPSPAIAETGVVFIIGDIVANVQLGTKRGTLQLKTSAAYRQASGDLVDLQTIVGGTGDFAGATGTLRVTGNFSGVSGTSIFQGTVCVP